MPIAVRSHRSISTGPVDAMYEVVLDPSGGQADIDALRAALAVVESYRSAAMRALKKRERDADWTMVEYDVKPDGVVVRVHQGACG